LPRHKTAAAQLSPLRLTMATACQGSDFRSPEPFCALCFTTSPGLAAAATQPMSARGNCLPRLSGGGSLSEGLARRLSHHGRAANSIFSHYQFVRNLDHRVSSRRTNILARLNGLVGKSLALGDAHASDGRLIIVRLEVARDCGRGNFLTEKAQTQGVGDLALIDTRHRVQAIHAEDIQIRHRVRIEGLLRQRQLDHVPAQSLVIFQLYRCQQPNRLGTLEVRQRFTEPLDLARNRDRYRLRG